MKKNQGVKRKFESVQSAEKPVSLKPLKLEEALEGLLKTAPRPKPEKR